MTLLLYFLFNIAGNAILTFSVDFYERNKIEAAHFSTYMEIPREELSELADTYDVTLEEQRYINIETNGVTARIFDRTKTVDLYENTQGKDVAVNMLPDAVKSPQLTADWENARSAAGMWLRGSKHPRKNKGGVQAQKMLK